MFFCKLIKFSLCTTSKVKQSKAKNRIPWNDFIFKQKPKEITLLGHLCPLSLIVVVGTCMVYFYYHRGVYLFFWKKIIPCPPTNDAIKLKTFFKKMYCFSPQKTILTFICCMCEIEIQHSIWLQSKYILVLVVSYLLISINWRLSNGPHFIAFNLQTDDKHK